MPKTPGYLEIIMPGRPVPWSRTATYQGRKITPKKQRDHSAELAMLALDHIPEGVEPVWRKGTSVSIVCTFVYRRPKKQTKEFPAGADLDNLVKQVKDALQGVLWENDTQIVELYATKMYGDEELTRLLASRHEA